MEKRIIVRIDDIGLNGRKERDAGLTVFRHLDKLMGDRNITFCACVIPVMVWGEDAVAFREIMDGGWAVPFSHGWDHEPSGRTKLDDEFGGLSFDEKRNRIALGASVLGGFGSIPVGMSAPFNRYDDEVLTACYKCGLRYFLAGYGREKPEVFENRNGLWVLPAEAGLYRRSGDKGEVLDVLTRLEPREVPYVLTLHAVWEATQFGDGTLERLLDQVSCYSYDVRNVERDYGRNRR